MREHLSKAKRRKDQKWVEGHFVHYVDCDGIDEYLIYTHNGNANDVIPETVCEFSGEYDKRHKRIFEDDFLKDNNGFVYRVVFEAGAFCLVAVTEFNIPYDTLPKDPDLDEFEGNLADNIVLIFALKWNNAEWYNSFEVIGNIHDNPELLK